MFEPKKVLYDPPVKPNAEYAPRAVFLLPLFLGLVINPKKLNAEMIKKKGLSEMKEHTHAHEFLNDEVY